MQNWQRELLQKNILLKEDVINTFHTGQIQSYYEFLYQNSFFFSQQDKKRILERHLYESIVFCYYLQAYVAKYKSGVVSRETTYLDVGSGAGLPGFLISCLKTSPQNTLLDSSKRRLRKLEEWCLQKSIHQSNSPSFIYKRLEEHIGLYDCIMARAFVPFPFLIELGCHLQKIGGIWAISVAHLKKNKRSRAISDEAWICNTCFAKIVRFEFFRIASNIDFRKSEKYRC